MVNAQEWLDKNYPLNRRNKITELDINEQLEGTLDLQDFTSLFMIHVHSSVDRKKFQIKPKEKSSNFSEKEAETEKEDDGSDKSSQGYYSEDNDEVGVFVIEWKNAQDYINQKFPTKEERKEITELNFEKMSKDMEEMKENLQSIIGLEGDLDLSDFVNLERLKFSSFPRNKVTNLNLTNCQNLQALMMPSNHLVDISFFQQLPNPEKLEVIDLSFNNITSDLIPFSCFTKLKGLVLGNYYLDKSDIKEGESGFYGSLEPLKNLTELKILDINNNEDAHARFVTEYFSNEKNTKTFPQKLQYWEKHKEKWEEKGFNEKEFKEWTNHGLKINEWDYADYLRQKNHKPSDANKKKLRKDYEKKVRVARISEEVFEKLKEFKKEKVYDNSIGTYNYQFTEEQKPLIKKLIPNKVLRQRYKKYGLCQECQQPNTGYNQDTEISWCLPCNSKHLEKNFDNWTSGNQKVDKLIQKSQSEAINADEVLEWIPYEQFEIEKDEAGNKKVVGEGGFGKIYKAIWTNGNITEWNGEKWEREENKEVVLKSLNNSSQNVTDDFLQEVANHKLCSGDFVVPLYGISQDPETGDYLMIMSYVAKGSLRNYLQKELKEKSGKKLRKLFIRQDRQFEKAFKLYHIIRGLNFIHEQGLIHRDFHLGNILNLNNGTDTDESNIVCCITDLGLSRPANEEKKEEEIYGVLPYVAPEVLQYQPYTQASDIYSYGVIAYEMITETFPYSDWNLSDKNSQLLLALEICKGLRPNLENVKTPQLIKDLIERCWDADPKKRPTAKELKDTAKNWFIQIVRKERINTGLYQQYLERFNEFSRVEVPNKYKINPKTMTSKPINTKQITELLKNLPKTSEKLYSTELVDFTSGISSLETELINLSVEDYEDEQFTQTEVPPKGNN